MVIRSSPGSSVRVAGVTSAPACGEVGSRVRACVCFGGVGATQMGSSGGDWAATAGGGRACVRRPALKPAGVRACVCVCSVCVHVLVWRAGVCCSSGTQRGLCSCGGVLACVRHPRRCSSGGVERACMHVHVRPLVTVRATADRTAPAGYQPIKQRTEGRRTRPCPPRLECPSNYQPTDQPTW